MTSACFRRVLVRAAVPALVLAQLVLADAGVLAGALAAGVAGHGHGHALSLLRDAGHVDVVLHHDEEGGPSASAGLGLAARDAHTGDHVVHVASADGPREGARRVVLAPSWLPAGAAASGSGSALVLAVRVAAGAPSGASALLRTVVLRI